MISDWRARAACTNAKPEWFVLPDGITAHPYATIAKSICAGCPVVAECLANARVSRDVGVYRAGQELRKPLVVCKRTGCTNEPTYGGVGTRPSYCSAACKTAAEDARVKERAIRAARRSQTKAATKLGPAVRTHCNNQHELAVVGTVESKNGSRLCVLCLNNRWPAQVAS